MPFENPFKKLSKTQLYISVGGAALIGGYMVIHHHSSTGSWNPWSSATAPATADSTDTTVAAGAGMVTDPSTGQVYSDTEVDPATQLTYASEIAQFGSVSTAESDVSSYGGSSSYSAPATQSYDTGYTYQQGSDNYTTVSGTSIYTSNSSWAQAVEAGLTSIGYSGTDVSTAIGAYLTGQPVNSTEAALISQGIAQYGNPPVGSFQIIPQSTTPTGPVSTSKPATQLPTGILVKPSKTTATVTWDEPVSTLPSAPNSQAWYVEVYQGATQVIHKVVETPSTNFTGLKANTSYTLKLRWNDPTSPVATKTFKTTP